MKPDAGLSTGQRNDLLRMLNAGLAAVSGERVVRHWFQGHPPQQDFALAAIGKAAAAMLSGAISAAGPRLKELLAISASAYAGDLLCAPYWVEGAHPVADQRSLAAGERLLGFLGDLPPGRPLVLCLSGGASSMVEVPRPGVDGAMLTRVNQWLLASGLAIHEVNAVRKALSRIKGGGLLDAIGDRPVTGLLISDVPGDDPAVIGSGLLTPHPGLAETLDGLQLPDWLAEQMPPAPCRQRRTAPTQFILASNGDARRAIAAAARRLGYAAFDHEDPVVGDAAAAGERLAGELLAAAPGIHIWGGETTVRLPESPGRGGRNQHLALAAALLIEGEAGVALLSAGSDGADGPGEDAGALVDGGTLARGRWQGLDPRQALARADSGRFLEAAGDLLSTGPTGTNVMDLIIGWKAQRP